MYTGRSPLPQTGLNSELRGRLPEVRQRAQATRETESAPRVKVGARAKGKEEDLLHCAMGSLSIKAYPGRASTACLKTISSLKNKSPQISSIGRNGFVQLYMENRVMFLLPVLHCRDCFILAPDRQTQGVTGPARGG